MRSVTLNEEGRNIATPGAEIRNPNVEIRPSRASGSNERKHE